MIINRLAAFYARVAPSTPGFVFERVSYFVTIDQEGQLLGIRSLDVESRGIVMEVPKGPVRTSAPVPYLLVDNAAYVLGAAMNPALAKPARKADAVRRLNKADKYFALFRDQWLSEVVPAATAASVPPTVYEPISKFLQRHDPAAFRQTDMFGMSGDERFFESWITFEVLREGEAVIPVEDPSLSLVLARLVRVTLARADRDICCVTGYESDISDTHFKIKGIPQSLSNQSSLSSFNEGAFRAYGLGSEEAVAPVSVDCMLAYTGSLNWLLGPEGAGNRQIVGDTAFLFWGDDGCLAKVREIIKGSGPGTPGQAEHRQKRQDAEAKKLFNSPFTGQVTEREPEVNVLGLTAAQARASVAYWCLGSTKDISQRVLSWVADIEWGAGLVWGEVLGERPWRPTIGRLVALVGVKGRGEAAERARGRVARALAACVFERLRVPADLARLAARAAVLGDWPGGSTNPDLATIVGFLGAYELRERNTSLEALMTDNSYMLGRFYSLVEKAEIDSLRARGANVAAAPVSKLKKAVYARPRWGFQELDDRFEVALKRLRPTSQVYYNRLRTSIISAMDPKSFPAISSDGNLFLIGAQHEAKSLWAPRVTEAAAS